MHTITIDSHSRCVCFYINDDLISSKEYIDAQSRSEITTQLKKDYPDSKVAFVNLVSYRKEVIVNGTLYSVTKKRDNSMTFSKQKVKGQ